MQKIKDIHIHVSNNMNGIRIQRVPPGVTQTKTALNKQVMKTLQRKYIQ